MGPEKPLPIDSSFDSADEYVDSLIRLLNTNGLLQTLCGGIHILDFLTATPDLYSQVVPEEWRAFFHQHNITDILDLLLRDNIHDLTAIATSSDHQWKDGPFPPQSLLQYVGQVRRHLLHREPWSNQCFRNRAMKPTQKLARHVAVGMNVKKVHEVGLFAAYINSLTDDIRSSTGKDISHVVDFGSGQNYLGRALASQPYAKNVVAVESKHHNIEGARDLDVIAKLATKQKVMRNKKAFRAGLSTESTASTEPCPKPTSEIDCEGCMTGTNSKNGQSGDQNDKTTVQIASSGNGTVQYIEHRIQDGDLSDVVQRMVDPPAALNNAALEQKRSHTSPTSESVAFETAQVAPSSAPATNKSLMTISLHSCGNLVHHGLRSLTMNPEVSAVALVGCCYNLITERLVPSTYKLPELRPQAHPRLEKTGKACDPHGFPMSDRFCTEHTQTEGGLNLNITARMMAVQAPANWGDEDSENFFTRHFYRAVLQRILLDTGVVDAPSACASLYSNGKVGRFVDGKAFSPAGHTSSIPIVIGSLAKNKYASFLLYTRAALAKLYKDSDPTLAEMFRSKTEHLTDEQIVAYETKYATKKKELAIVWSLMAFSAGVVEAAIVVDRWLWLREQEVVQSAWVEPVFDYRMSPRNLVVVGVKK